MAENTYEDRLTRLEEQFKALQALTLRLASWEGGISTLELDALAPEPAAVHAQAGPTLDDGARGERTGLPQHNGS